MEIFTVVALLLGAALLARAIVYITMVVVVVATGVVLELNGRRMNIVIMQQALHLIHGIGILIILSLSDPQMRRRNHFIRIQAPNVKVVNIKHTLHGSHMVLELIYVKMLGRRLQ